MDKFPRLLGAGLGLAVFLLPGFACGSSGSTGSTPVISESAAPTSLFVTSSDNETDSPSAVLTPALPPTVSGRGIFQVAVIVDTTSESATREQAAGLIDQAGRLLSPFSPIGLQMTDFAEDSGGGTTDELAGRYIASHAAALPNGILVLSTGDDGRAALDGGYGGSLPAPSGFRNAFVSPVIGANQIYLVVVDFNYKYAACGYGDSQALQSPVSVGGECGNRPGTACVQRNGYSMCADVAGDLYSSKPAYFAASTLVHQLLSVFSPGGNRDHYATPECNARMGYPEGFYDKQEGEYYNGLCPFVYEDFTNSYQP